MAEPIVHRAPVAAFATCLKAAMVDRPRAGGRAVMAQAPAVVDVMGGICESSGSLLLTATLGLAVRACVWQTDGVDVAVRHQEAATGLHRDVSIPLSAFGNGPVGASSLMEKCREAGIETAIPACLVLDFALGESVIPRPAGGLAICLQSEIPIDADLGGPCATAASTLVGLCKLFDVQGDRLQKARLCAEASECLTGVPRLRTAMTALYGLADRCLLQLRFKPELTCGRLPLPPETTLAVVRTRLARPTTLQRLRETQTCAEMGQLLIRQMQQGQGQPADPKSAVLASVNPSDYVERFRDRLPAKIAAKTFTAKFGTVRGLDGRADLPDIYKVRSRSEHHIYENRRVHDFVAHLNRASRLGAVDGLVQAGEEMYASHWSHTQRCGIGGVETDRIKEEVRKRGAPKGLYGAKVTGGGAGGEVVVLMRDDSAARAALAEAVADAQKTSGHPIHTHDGSLAGAEYFEPPQMAELLDPAIA